MTSGSLRERAITSDVMSPTNACGYISEYVRAEGVVVPQDLSCKVEDRRQARSMTHRARQFHQIDLVVGPQR